MPEVTAKTLLAQWSALCDAHRLPEGEVVAQTNVLIPPAGKRKGATAPAGARMLLMNAIKRIQEDQILPFVEVETVEVEGSDPVTVVKVAGKVWSPYIGVKSSKDSSVSTDDLLASLADARAKFATATAAGFESAAARQSDRIDAIVTELTARGVEVPPAE